MNDNIEEKEITTSPKAVSFEQTKKILEQMEKCTCVIKIKNTNGTGFFCKVPHNERQIPVLMTNFHVLYDKDEKIRDEKIICIQFKENNVKEFGEDRIIYKSKKYDTVIIKIRNEDNINNFFELDDNLLSKNPLLYKNESIYTIHYPSTKLSVSYGIVNDIQKNFEIKHACSTDKGSSGSPILKLDNNKIFAIHKQANNEEDINIGTFLKEPINEFINHSPYNYEIIKR